MKISKAKISTRASLECPMFGLPQELSEIVLPTHTDVMKYCITFMYGIRSRRKKMTTEHPSVSEVVEHVAEKIKQIWREA